MSNPTPAQEEYAELIARNNDAADDSRVHPEDRDEEAAELAGARIDDEDEEDRYRAAKIDAAMRTPAVNGAGAQQPRTFKLPPASFDNGRATGVKGVIADARSYENARRTQLKDRVRAARRSVFGAISKARENSSGPESEGSAVDDPEDQDFLRRWRESRRQELEAESKVPKVRNRRTSPSVRLYGRLDEVDALGYLDAIEKVGRETVVVVFVYDHQCQVSATVEHAMKPLVTLYPAVRFVKVHYEDIEFDNAAVPAILAYKDQGDLFANLTGLIEMIPEDEDFDSDSLKRMFQEHGIF